MTRLFTCGLTTISGLVAILSVTYYVYSDHNSKEAWLPPEPETDPNYPVFTKLWEHMQKVGEHSALVGPEAVHWHPPHIYSGLINGTIIRVEHGTMKIEVCRTKTSGCCPH